MKIRELFLWLLVIVAIVMIVGNHMLINMQYEIIKTMGETQGYILELIDLKAGWYLM